jgi:hypothetical protein
MNGLEKQLGNIIKGSSLASVCVFPFIHYFISFRSLLFAIGSYTMPQIQQHPLMVLQSIHSLVPWKGGIEDYLEACSDGEDNGLLVYSSLQRIRNHFSYYLRSYLAKSKSSVKTHSNPPISLSVLDQQHLPPDQISINPIPT